MNRAIERPSPDLQTAITQVFAAGRVLEHDFGLRIEDVDFEEKDDLIRSIVSRTDVAASNLVVGGIAAATGERTITEEYARTLPELVEFLAKYGDENAWCLDPLDGTQDFRDAMLLNPDMDPRKDPRLSLAIVSLAKIAHGRPKVGTLLAPLLDGSPRLYAAEEGQGAFVQVDGVRTELQVNASHNEGVVLVSQNQHPHIERIANKGLRVLGIGGLAFKMLSVVDPRLIHTYASRLPANVRKIIENEPIIGLASPTASLHDYAAAAVVLREAHTKGKAGAVVTSVTGLDRLPIGPGEHGIIAANNDRTHGILVDAMRDSRQPYRKYATFIES